MKKIFITWVLVLALSAAGDIWAQGKSGKEKTPKGKSGAVSNPGKGKGRGLGKAKNKNKAGSEDAVEAQADEAEKSQEAKSEDADIAGAVEGQGQGQGQTAAEPSKEEVIEALAKKQTGQKMVVRQIDKNIEKEKAKHYERVAKLERVRELMEKMENEEGAREAEQLLAKENQRHRKAMEVLTKGRGKAQTKLDRIKIEAELVERMSTDDK